MFFASGYCNIPGCGRVVANYIRVLILHLIFLFFSCVQVVEHHAADIDVYHCPNCEPIHGPSMSKCVFLNCFCCVPGSGLWMFPSFFAVKKRNNWHRHDYTEPNDGTRPVQAGTAVFVQQLQARSFARYKHLWIKTWLDFELSYFDFLMHF